MYEWLPLLISLFYSYHLVLDNALDDQLLNHALSYCVICGTLHTLHSLLYFFTFLTTLI